MRRNLRLGSRLTLGATICLVGVAIAACGGSETGEQAPTQTARETTAPTIAAASPTVSPAPTGGPAITIADMRFPESLTVPPGAEVTVTNNDPAEHSVTSDTAGQFDVEIQPDATATFAAPSQPGSYPYHCSYHPSMNGVLVVQ